MSRDPVIWVSAIVTIIAFSYLFKENELYKAVEHLYVGVAAGYTLVMGYNNIVSKVWTPLSRDGNFVVLIPAVIGLMLYVPYISKQYSWIKRIPIAVIVGIGMALTARTQVMQQFIEQIKATMVPINSINSFIILLGTIGTLCYFLFTFKPSLPIKTGSEIGKWTIMITLGAAFGAGIMGRISLLIDRMFLIFRDWIPLIKLH
ncbi:MAG TPA: hypothetical protein PLF08_05935 [Bacillota bacterium]|nr:hypothetical protein [Candidatus Fermentithermobacillaceae bacterium]HOB31024.1 hypothetical protein [Bacillota bacterium]HOQ03414.1 hypothetical protein [Bacillota bacterium]HPV13789.1 hypothetical protein [Bacillota bacterium]HPZ78570.1 hypothetical protein [Bacillota bacterium]